MQAQVEWLGLGSPASGQWLTPHAERSGEIACVIRRLGLNGTAHSLVGTLREIASAPEFETARGTCQPATGR